MQAVRFEEIEIGLSNQQSTSVSADDSNPLVKSAIPLFAIASQMKYYYSNLGSTDILKHLKTQIEIFEEQSENMGVRYETVRTARYCLCTLLDEFAAKYGWADQEWMASSLLVTLHSETWGGEQFFDMLDKIKVEPQKNLNLIEFMYYCLVIGYMGKYQVLNNGQVSIHNLKKELEKIITKYKSPPSLPLLIDKSSVGKLKGIKDKVIPIWAMALVFSLLLLGIYKIFDYQLTNKTDSINQSIQALTIPTKQDIPIASTQPRRLTPLLKNEIESGLIEVSETPTASKITILGDELFASGSDKIEDRFFPVLASVSQALNIVHGQIIVSGYTDDRPISSLTYPSNWHLSQGRADAVKQILLRYIEDASRVRSEGKGDQNPILPNDSELNRAKNRRVEIIVYLNENSPALQDTEDTQINIIQQ